MTGGSSRKAARCAKKKIIMKFMLVKKSMMIFAFFAPLREERFWDAILYFERLKRSF